MFISKIITFFLVFVFGGASARAQVLSTPNLGAPPPEETSSGRIYIAVGDPSVKKVLMAVESTLGVHSSAREFNSTLISDLSFTDFFEFLPPGKMPQFVGDIKSYRALGVDFFIQSSMKSEGGKFQADLKMYDVKRGTIILNRTYPLIGATSQPGRELAHSAGNDVIQALTGELGIFRSRILMSCGSKRKEIYIMDFDGQNVRRLTQDGYFALSPSWAPDGQRILFTSYKPSVKGGFVNPNLYMLDTRTNARRLLSAAKGLNTGGVFHPTQEKVAYTFSRDGRPEIYILDLAQNTRTPITKTLFFSVEPSWSPDGRQIVFSSSKTGKPHIWVAMADGSNAKRLTFAGEYNSSPDWSPRGDKIVFSGQENMGNNFNIFMVDPTGSNLVRITDDTTSNENPSFSPDGRLLAFSSNRDGQYRIYVMTALGTQIRVLSPKNLGPCKQPSWSPRL